MKTVWYLRWNYYNIYIQEIILINKNNYSLSAALIIANASLAFTLHGMISDKNWNRSSDATKFEKCL